MKKLVKMTAAASLAAVMGFGGGALAGVTGVGTIADPGNIRGAFPQEPFAGAAVPVIVVIAPTDLSKEATTSNTEVKVFNEKQNVILGGPLTVDQTVAGDPDSGADIPAGTVVNSHFIHFDNVGTSIGRRGVGSVTFDGNILGLITQDSSLGATNTELGNAGTTFAIPPNIGLEQGTGGVGDFPGRSWRLQDIILKIDGNTMEFDLQVFNVLDQLRVVTEAVINTEINVHPGSDPNPLNIDTTKTNASTPVAIFGSATLDVETIDISQLMLATAGVKTVGKADRELCKITEIGSYDATKFDNLGVEDEYPDLVCHFVTAGIMLETTDTTVDLFIAGCDDKTTTPPTDSCNVGDDGYYEFTKTDAVKVVNSNYTAP